MTNTCIYNEHINTFKIKLLIIWYYDFQKNKAKKQLNIVLLSQTHENMQMDWSTLKVKDKCYDVN